MNNELWNAEFCGFFWGEGCADLQKYSRKNRGCMYRPRLRITLRSDDEPILLDIQEHLGGTVTKGHNAKNYKWKTQTSRTWCLSNKESVVCVCDILLKGCMPAKKLKQIKVIRKAAKLRAGKLGHVTDNERTILEKCYKLAQYLKKFK